MRRSLHRGGSATGSQPPAPETVCQRWPTIRPFGRSSETIRRGSTRRWLVPRERLDFEGDLHLEQGPLVVAPDLHRHVVVLAVWHRLLHHLAQGPAGVVARLIDGRELEAVLVRDEALAFADVEIEARHARQCHACPIVAFT